MGQTKAKKIGYPLITNHSNSEYQGKVVVNEIEIDDHGMVYFAADDHIYRFDGKNYFSISLVNYESVSSIEIIKDRIYFNAEKGYGYITFKNGEHEVHNLIDEFDFLSTFNGSKEVFEKDGLIYFFSSGNVVTYNPIENTASLKKMESSVQSVHQVNDQIFVQIKRTEIFELIEDSLHYSFSLKEDGELIESSIRDLAKIKGEIYLGLRYNGLFKKKGNEIERVEGDVDFDMKNKRGLFFKKLSNELYGVISITSGLILYDKNLNRVNTISIDEGILNNIGFGINLTRNGDLLLGTIAGISILHIGTPVTTIDGRHGMPSDPVMGFSSAVIHDKFYYVIGNTLWGVDCQGENEGEVNPFYTIKEDERVGSFLRTYKEYLYFAGQERGLYRLDENGKVEQLGKIPVYRILNVSDEYILLMQRQAIVRFTIKNNRVDTLVDFKKEKIIVNSNVDIESNQEEACVWMGDKANQLYHLQMTSDLSAMLFFEKIGKPQKAIRGIQNIYGGMVFSNNDVVTKYDAQSKEFSRVKELSVIYKNYETKPLIVTDNNYNIWMYQSTVGARKFRLNSNGVYEEDEFARESKRITKGTWVILPISEKHVFFLSNSKGLYHIDYSGVYPDSWEVKPYIKSIRSVSGDTSYFSGINTTSSGISYLPAKPYTFDSENNSIRVDYGGIYYGDHKELEFRIKIPGMQEEWSTWTTENYKEIINIREGEYSIEIQARNSYKIPSRSETIHFTVLPPWYKTIWAYITYVILSFVFVLTIVRLNSRRLIKQKKELEKIVEERTHEVRMQNETLQQQTEEILTQAEDLETSNEELNALLDKYTVTNKQLEKKNIQITDSINYAKKIQMARLLPIKNCFINDFNKAFMLFQPKDIVSGDFYWYYSGSDYDYVCAADCTGHGVPGAFMSILGVDILEKIVHRGVVEPEHILDELSLEIHNLLRKNNSEVKDGMDLSIVAIKKDKSIAKVAGVQNPVYLVRDGEVVQYKTDKIEIGVVGESKYSAQVIELKPGDVFYQFTDGFADQRGGPKNKKFFYPPFRKLLLEISGENFDKQEQILKENFVSWKGNTEQYDDVCIVGYKVS